MGSHLCDRFHNEGWNVICMDNLITGAKSNINHLLDQERFEFIHYDVTNYLNVDCTEGWYKLEPFQTYSGVKGVTSDGTKLPPDPHHQQARQMDNEALAIKEGRDPIVPGIEGLRDIRIVRAIMESSDKDGAKIKL